MSDNAAEREPFRVDQNQINALPLDEYARRPNQEVSRAYQVAYHVFSGAEEFCEVEVNPAGEKFLLGPELMFRRTPSQYERTFMPKEEGSPSTANASVRFATRIQGKKPVLDMPYAIVVNNNITATDLRINPQGTFEISGDGVEITEVSQIGQLADETLKSIERYRAVQQREKREKRSRWIGRGVAIVVLSAIGGVGYGVYNHLHSQKVEAAKEIEDYDSKKLILNGTQLDLTEPGSVLVNTASQFGESFESIPEIKKTYEEGTIRTVSFDSGTCLQVATLSEKSPTLTIGKEPGELDEIAAIVSPTRKVFVCSPQRQTYTSGDSTYITKRNIALQVNGSREG